MDSSRRTLDGSPSPRLRLPPMSENTRVWRDERHIVWQTRGGGYVVRRKSRFLRGFRVEHWLITLLRRWAPSEKWMEVARLPGFFRCSWANQLTGTGCKSPRHGPPEGSPRGRAAVSPSPAASLAKFHAKRSHLPQRSCRPAVVM